jgi:hypothetical protein
MTLPKRLEIGQLYQTPLFQLHNTFQMYVNGADPHANAADKGPIICGYVIPPFQRDFVWTNAQMVRFVESAFYGLPLGTFTYNTTVGMQGNKRIGENGEEYYAGNRWLLDGQQRLTTLHKYFSNEFSVFDHYWSDLDNADKMGLLMKSPFPSYETKIADELECRKLYDILAFGGTPHEPSQRAVPGL